MKIHGLTDRQLEVAALVARGLTVKEIALALQNSEGEALSPYTVHFHIDRIVLAWDLDPARDARIQIALRYTQLSSATAA